MLALATARAIGRDPARGAAAGGGARADPHLLADPRRPAGDGRRRPAPRPADLPRRVRRGRRDPRRRRALRRGVPPRARPHQQGEPARVLAAVAELAAATGVDGMVGGQYLDVAERGPDGADGLRRLHELKTGRLIGASVECVLLLDGAPANLRQSRFRDFAAELGVLFQIVDDILDVTGTDARSASRRAATSATASAPTSASSGSTARASWPPSRIASARAALARGGARRAPPSSSRSPTSSLHAHLMTDQLDRPLLDRIDRPQDLHGLSEDELAAGRAGGPRAHHRHGRRDRRPLRRQPRHLRARGRAALAAGLAARQDPLGRRPPGLPAQGPHRPPRPARDDPPVRRPRAVLLDRRVRARHHGRRPRLDLDRLRRRAQGGDAPRGDGEDGKVVAVIGDGAMTGGVAFEAIHQAGGLGTPIVVVLNDNGMSIAPNVGALSRYFNRVRLNPKLWHAREGVEERPDEAARPASARAFERLGPQLKESIKAFWAPGPVLGGARLGLHGRHRRPRRARAARRAARGARRRAARSSCTSRRSRARASRPPRTAAWRAWRSGTPPSRSRSPTARRAGRRAAPRAPRQPPPPQYTQVFGEALVARRAATARVVGITAAMNSGTGLNILQKAMPERYFDVGIAEQQAVLFAAGLALRGRQAGRARSTRRSCSAPSTRSSTTSACRSSTSSSRWTAPASSATTARRTTASFDIAYLRCLPNIVADGAARRGDARAHAAHRAALRRRPGRAALPARRGRRRAAARARRSAIAIGTRRDPARGRRRGRAASATAPASARRSRPPTCSPSTGIDGDRRRRALRQAARRRR